MAEFMVYYEPGHIVPFRLAPGIVAASYFVSFAGAVTSVELLHRRICTRGWQKWVELFSCALTFALVGIWCMHYVGNQAIILGNGETDLQLVYNPGYTALSSLLPIIAMFAAFTIADVRHRGHKRFVTSLVLSGVVAGGAVVAMHYTGNFGITNYQIELNHGYIGGAVVIACATCVTALALIFVLQDRWISILPYRLCAAGLLAGGVSSMHFVATMGTAYRLKYTLQGHNSRMTNLILAVVFSLLTIPICIGLSIGNARRQRMLADRAQQVVLACARFDEEGRIMVTTEGLLPSHKITIHENQRSFDDQFNVNHPVFQWCFRLSHNWSSIIRWLPNMNRHLQAVNFVNEPHWRGGESRRSSISWELTAEGEAYPLAFRQSFCVAASRLAAEFNEVLCDVGTLYEGVMMTGSVLPQLAHRRRILSRHPSTASVATANDLEANTGCEVFGKGQLLFLMKQCDARSTSRLVSEGFRFVNPATAVKHMARSMQVSPVYLSEYFESMRNHAKAENTVDVPTGTLLGLFVLRAGIQKRNFEVLVRKDIPHQLPCVQLSPALIDSKKIKLLAQFESLSAAMCLSQLAEKIHNLQDPDIEFWRHLRMKILALQDMVNEPWFCDAIFSSRVIRVPTLFSDNDQSSGYSLIVFHIIPDVHIASLKSSVGLRYTPFSFFKCRQQILQGLQHRASFDRKVHQEFATLFTPKAIDNSNSKARKGQHFTSPLKWADAVRSNSATTSLASICTLALSGKDSTASEHGDHVGLPTETSMPFGGIMVSSDVTVEEMLDASSKKSRETNAHIDKSAITTHAYAGTGDLAASTYADELYALAVAKWCRGT